MTSPAELAKKFIEIGKNKANLHIDKMFLLAMLAGIFIGFGGLTSLVLPVSLQEQMPSVAKVLSAMMFTGGLTMVLCAGSELFTGNNLMAIALLEKEITIRQMLRNWIVVWIGNLAGSILLAALCVYSHEIGMFSGGLAANAISVAVGKVTLTFSDALLRGIACNFLVCIAVWIGTAASTISSKFIGLFFPVTMFVACGFEHSVANMFFISAGLFAKHIPAYVQAAAEAGVDFSSLTWGNMFTRNLLPVTLGNILGGFFCVGCTYWIIYLRKRPKWIADRLKK